MKIQYVGEDGKTYSTIEEANEADKAYKAAIAEAEEKENKKKTDKETLDKMFSDLSEQFNNVILALDEYEKKYHEEYLFKSSRGSKKNVSPFGSLFDLFR